MLKIIGPALFIPTIHLAVLLNIAHVKQNMSTLDLIRQNCIDCVCVCVCVCEKKTREDTVLVSVKKTILTDQDIFKVPSSWKALFKNGFQPVLHFTEC